jgi:hypothetical protein
MTAFGPKGNHPAQQTTFSPHVVPNRLSRWLVDPPCQPHYLSARQPPLTTSRVAAALWARLVGRIPQDPSSPLRRALAPLAARAHTTVTHRARPLTYPLPCGPRSTGESSSWTPHRSELNELRVCRRRFSRAVDPLPPRAESTGNK